MAYYLLATSRSCSASVYLFSSMREQAVLYASSKLLFALTPSLSIMRFTSEALPAATKPATEFTSTDSILGFGRFWYISMQASILFKRNNIWDSNSMVAELLSWLFKDWRASSNLFCLYKQYAYLGIEKVEKNINERHHVCIYSIIHK